MDELQAALNTYRVLILEDDPHDIVGEDAWSLFFVDVSEYPNFDNVSALISAEHTLEVLENHEHYEKCADIRDYIINLKIWNLENIKKK